MNTEQIRKKLHSFIDVAEDKKVKAIYAMIEESIETQNYLTAEQKIILDERLADYLSGKSKTVSLKKAITNTRQKIKTGIK